MLLTKNIESEIINDIMYSILPFFRLRDNPSIKNIHIKVNNIGINLIIP